jgi:hypothetical protein
VSLHIQNVLKTTNSFSEILAIAENSQEHVSFFGARYVTVVGYSGSLHIDDLAFRVQQMVKENPHFNEEGRDSGKKLIPLIDGLFEKNDQRLEGRNGFTRFLAGWRDDINLIHYNDKGPRFYWEHCESKWVFYYYSKEQYEAVYNESPSVSHDDFESRGVCHYIGGCQRWPNREYLRQMAINSRIAREEAEAVRIRVQEELEEIAGMERFFNSMNASIQANTVQISQI